MLYVFETTVIVDDVHKIRRYLSRGLRLEFNSTNLFPAVLSPLKRNKAGSFNGSSVRIDLRATFKKMSFFLS
jgi:hypothetical protein